MQPYDRGTMKILCIISLVLVAGYFIPSFENNTIISMIIRSAIVSIAYFILIFYMKIIPEFDKYFTWILKRR